MFPLVAMASLLAGAAYFGLPEMLEEQDPDRDPDTPDPQDLSDGGLFSGGILPPVAHITPSLLNTDPAMPLPGGGAEHPALPQDDLADVDSWYIPESEPGIGALRDAPHVPETVAQAGHDVNSALSLDDIRHLAGTLGAEGDDWLTGGAGDDSLHAGAGSNDLFGGSASDLLMGLDAHFDPALGLHALLTPASGPTADVLEDGDGDGDGDGDDPFFVRADQQQIDVDLPRIEDFDPEHDRLVLAVPFTEEQIIAAWPDTPVHAAEVTVRDFADGTGATICVDGMDVADVVGAQGLDPALILLTGADMAGPDMCEPAETDPEQSYWSGLEKDAAARALMERPVA